MTALYVNFLSIFIEIESEQGNLHLSDPFREVKRVSHKHNVKERSKSIAKSNSQITQKSASSAKLVARGRRNSSDWLIETYQNLEISMSDNAAEQEQAVVHQSEECVDNSADVAGEQLPSDQTNFPPLETVTRENIELDKTTKKKETVASAVSLVVECGNPNVEQVRAIIHFYKLNERISATSNEVARPSLLCILGVPVSITLKELLGVLGSWTDLLQLREVKVLRPADTRSNAYLTLLQFADSTSADCFFASANGRAYSSFDTESICNVVYVDQLELGDDAKAHFEGLGGLPRVTELPNCPVCLERLDEPLQGMLTSTLCNHVFHLSCLTQWTDNNCPVCRYAQTPELVSDNRCGECDTRDNLWLCLICGNVGCGRYNEAHAEKHFHATSHAFAMQVGTDRVWDYVQDEFVHRLVQNKADGKLVEISAPPGGATHANEEKLDALQLEFTYLVTSQLESQRQFYEAKLNALEKRFSEQFTRCDADASALRSRLADCEAELARAQRERTAAERKLAQTTSKLQAVQRELDDERQMNADLRQNQSKYLEMLKCAQTRYDDELHKRDLQVAELREQNNDLLANFEMADRVRQSGLSNDELASSSLSVGDSSQNAGASASASRKAHSRRKK